MRDKIAMGLMVKCCESYVEVRQGDIGRVTKVRSSACDVCGETVPLVYACCVGVREYIESVFLVPTRHLSAVMMCWVVCVCVLLPVDSCSSCVVRMTI